MSSHNYTTTKRRGTCAARFFWLASTPTSFHPVRCSWRRPRAPPGGVRSWASRGRRPRAARSTRRCPGGSRHRSVAPGSTAPPPGHRGETFKKRLKDVMIYNTTTPSSSSIHHKCSCFMVRRCHGERFLNFFSIFKIWMWRRLNVKSVRWSL